MKAKRVTASDVRKASKLAEKYFDDSANRLIKELPAEFERQLIKQVTKKIAANEAAEKEAAKK